MTKPETLSWLERFDPYSLYFFSILLFLFFLPHLILAENSYITVHDNLDHLPSFTVLARGNNLFNYGGLVPQVMNGLPRAFLPNAYNVFTLLFALFTPFVAYMVNYIVAYIVAFGGMYILLSKYFRLESKFLVAGVSFGFAILPFYPTAGLSVAGMPILLYAVLNTVQGTMKTTDLMILLFFPFYSSFILVGVFILSLISRWFVIDAICQKKINYKFFIPIVVLFLLYFSFEYHLFAGLLFGGLPVAHRTEFNYVAHSVSFSEVLKTTFTNFLYGHYHAASLHYPVTILLVILSSMIAVYKRMWKNFRSIVVLLLLIIVFSLVFSLQNWSGLNSLKAQYPYLYMFQFGRFHFLHPILWWLLFAHCLTIVRIADFKMRKIALSGAYVAVAIVLLQSVNVMAKNKEFVRASKLLASTVVGRDNTEMTYARFFAKEQYDLIRADIGLPQADYRVVSLALPPVVATYNGFYTLDFYSASYPLVYKHKFRKLMARELAKSDTWRRYFDDWGNRCYLFSSELTMHSYLKNSAVVLQNFEFDSELFHDMGGQYLLSGVEIGNYKESNLVFVNKYVDRNSSWDVYLYRVMPEAKL